MTGAAPPSSQRSSTTWDPSAQATPSPRQIELLAAATRRLGNAIVLTDVYGFAEWVNEGFCKISGYAFDEVIGTNPFELVHGAETDEASKESIATSVVEGKPFLVELLAYARSGRQYWVRVDGQPTLDASGRVTGFVCIQTDITEERIASGRAHVVKRVGERLLDCTSVEEAAEVVVRELVGALDVRAAQAWLVDPGVSSLRYLVGASASATGQRWLDFTRTTSFVAGTDWVVGVGTPGVAWGTAAPCMRTDFWQTDPNGSVSRRASAARDAGVRTVCAVPVHAPGGVVAVLETGGSHNYPGHERIPELVERVAQQFGSFVVQHRHRQAFEVVFRHSPDPMLVLDGAGKVTRMNARACDVFGEALGATVEDLFLEGAESLVASRVGHTDGDLIAVTARREDGTAFPAEVSLSVTDAEGAPSSVLAVRDLTERLAAERKLASSERRFRSLVEHLVDPMFVLDESGRIIDVNPAALRHVGVTRAALVGRMFYEIQPGYSPDLVSDAPLDADGARVLEAVHLGSAGIEIPVELRLVVIELDRRPGYLAITRDLTERRRQEAAAREYHTALERRVQERTAELADARDAAVAAAKAKSEFLANMSHEIRTPLNAIIGLTHLGLECSTDPKQSDYLSKSQQAARSLLAIVNDILDYSKIEAGKLTLEAARFDLTQVFDQLDAFLGTAAQSKGLSLTTRIAPGAPRALVGDALRLGQVLLNLASNAVKFTESGAVTVEARLRTEGNEQVELAFSVHDTGIGLDAEQVGKLMQPFMQADASTTRRFGGTGLGLAISRRLVEAMGGTLTIESALGSGSTFTFTARFGVATDDAPLSSELRSEEFARAAHDGARFLLVEDNEINQLVAVELLNTIGATADVASDGVEALERLASAKYDLVLMDVQMPRMDGFETTRRIRMIPAFATLPVIAMTANTSREDAEECLASGMNDVLHKPIDPDGLYRALAKWLPRGNQSATPATD